ncbi:Uncharacterized protein TCM_028281 [Theobroma cacao]|uniref:Uncharacterized protein n=1 Tax=Theobroma cacao TaxID=3641 RepID=A0A061G9D8_THECC|nr:Uncharacterized protein TCM_028281 [Theobroma cacao]
MVLEPSHHTANSLGRRSARGLTSANSSLSSICRWPQGFPYGRLPNWWRHSPPGPALPSRIDRSSGETIGLLLSHSSPVDVNPLGTDRVLSLSSLCRVWWCDGRASSLSPFSCALSAFLSPTADRLLSTSQLPPVFEDFFSGLNAPPECYSAPSPLYPVLGLWRGHAPLPCLWALGGTFRYPTRLEFFTSGRVREVPGGVRSHPASQPSL